MAGSNLDGQVNHLVKSSDDDVVLNGLIAQLFEIQDLGLIVVDDNQVVCLWSGWTAKYSGIGRNQAKGQHLLTLFDELENSRLSLAIENAIEKGVSSVLSQIFNKYPLPLFFDSVARSKNQRINQQINVRPLCVQSTQYVLIEIKNVTASVSRENVLKRQTKEIKSLLAENVFQKQHLQRVFDSSADAIVTLSKDGKIIESNRSTLQIFNTENSEFYGKSITKIVPDFDINKAGSYSFDKTFKGITKDDNAIYLEIYANQLEDNNDYIVATLRDVTQRQKMEETIFRSERLAQTALDSIADGVITTDASGIIELVNPIAESLLVGNKLNIEGQTIQNVFKLIDETPEQLQDNIVLKSIELASTINSQNDSALITSKYPEGLPVIATASPIFDFNHEVSGCVLVFRDVQESRRLSTRLSWEASHDALTGLANRRAFNLQLEEIIKQASSASLLFLDLDRFKLVNDTAGHSIGDELLKRISEIFIKHFRDNDFICRLGGDEFSILLKACPLDKARELAQDLCANVDQYSFPWQDRIFTVGVSVGLTEVCSSDKSASKVLERADAACYSAKQSGRSRVHVYGESERETDYQANIYRASVISEAISNDQFILYKQPIISISDNKRYLHHYEILVRMIGEDEEIIPPGDFIPAAEQFGLMQSIDRYVIVKTIEYVKNKRGNDDTVAFAINLSGASIIDEKFQDFLDKIIEAENVCPEEMHFEITETAAISNLTRAKVFIEHFRAKGFLFALDDFGSGMSSFGYLKNLPVDYIKIDGQFVKEIVGNETDFAMVSSINYLGHMMGLKCIAEFVENEDILQTLNEIGVDFAQGYGIEKPTPLYDK